MAHPSFSLIAVNGADAFALADCFPSVPLARFCSSNRWAWLRFDPAEPLAKALGLSTETVEKSLATLRRPFLIILAEENKGWRISLVQRKQKVLRAAFHNEVYRPATRSPSPHGERSIEGMFARLEADLPETFRTPKEVIEKGRGKTLSKGLSVVRRAQGQRVRDWVNARDDIGDGNLLGHILSGEVCSPAERIGPFNVLPRFLDGLLLGKALLDEDGRWRVGPWAKSAGTFGRSQSLYESAPSAELIPNGPVELPTSDLGRFWLLSWFCETDSETDILIEPAAETRVLLPQLDSSVISHRRGDRTYVEMTWRPPGLRAGDSRELGNAIAAAPAGTAIEFISGTVPELDDEEEEGKGNGDADRSSDARVLHGCQRYRGVLSDHDTFLLTHSSVAVTPGELLTALEICRQLDQPRASFTMPSEQDARAVVELARRTNWFAEEKFLPRVQGATVIAASRDHAMTTAMMVFRKRFENGPWNPGEGQQRDEQNRQEWDTLIDEVSKSVSDVLAAPTGNDLILQTERAVFRAADWSKMNLGVLDTLGYLWGRTISEDEPLPQTAAEKLEPIDRAFADLGFNKLGDIHCDRFGELYLRGYGGPTGDTFGCIIAGTFGQFSYEFVTRFAGKGGLTTSTTPDLKNNKKLKIYKQSFPELEPAALYQQHRTTLAKLTTDKVKPKPIEATIVGFCQAIDDYIKQEL